MEEPNESDEKYHCHGALRWRTRTADRCGDDREGDPSEGPEVRFYHGFDFGLRKLKGEDRQISAPWKPRSKACRLQFNPLIIFTRKQHSKRLLEWKNLRSHSVSDLTQAEK
jgi:hypothetical protein